jgi:Cu-Zn family superoxide dismutase
MKNVWMNGSIALLAVVVLTACPKKETTEAKTAAPAAKPVGYGILAPKSGSQLNGNASFFPAANGEVRVVVTVASATPGSHGVHIHEKGDCSAPDAASAGGHLNPKTDKHGGPATEHHHAGDLGNIVVDDKGQGRLEITVKGLVLDNDSPNGVLNRSVVVHEKADDLATDPSGNSGARIGCAVIGRM